MEKVGGELFEFQNWIVYQKSIEWVGLVQTILNEKKLPRHLSDQISRASTSIPLNISEGSSRFTKKDKTNFLRIARGSVFECVAIIDVLKIQKRLSIEECEKYTKTLSEIGRMLSAFINWIEQSTNPSKRK